MTLEEILQLQDIDEKISYLKKARKTEQPNRETLYNDWNPNRHEIIINKEKYPQITITLEAERTVFDKETGKTRTIPAKTKQVDPNRIAIPLEQDIVNIQTAFTVGEEPLMECEPSEDEKGLFEALKLVFKKNKIKYQNKKIVRSWLSEQECAEYWYVVKDEGFWVRLLKKLGISVNVKPDNKLKSAIWSPFRGDTLYPFFDDTGDLVALSREYERKNIDDTTEVVFMTVTSEMVYTWKMTSETKEWEETKFAHKFKKLPVIYCYRPEAYCNKIKTIRVRLEKLLSNYADCIDYHFFPILKLFGGVDKVSGDFKNRVVELTGEGADAQYLTWNQASETVKLELDSLIEKAYSMTHTPRVMPENLHGLGTSFSGVSFRYMFMGAHLSVENHTEVIGEFMQRRVNFLVSALGSINTGFEKASNTIDIDVTIQPYMIDSLDDKVNTAIKAVDGHLWTRREGIMFVGNTDRIDETLKEIEEEMETEQSQNNNKIGFK